MGCRCDWPGGESDGEAGCDLDGDLVSFPFLEDGRSSIDLGADPWDVVLARGLPSDLLCGTGGGCVVGGDCVCGV